MAKASAAIIEAGHGQLVARGLPRHTSLTTLVLAPNDWASMFM